ncbi:MAG TPA: RNA polymerase sigma-54 factor, partial [Candidatus Kryptonia bacterium]|nr:RNA polymerase sigma-54 factor [Candidatus Kryptonia bacterium]
MALETRLYQKLSQQLVMTPQLRQAIKILQVSRAELEEMIDQELTENPALEEEVGARVEEDDPRPRTEENLETQPTESTDSWEPPAETERETTSEVAPDNQNGEIDWKEYLENYRNDWQGATATPADYDEDKRPSLENTLVRSSSLTEHLIWQLRMAGLTPLEESVAALMIGNMDEAGYLRVPIEDIAFQSGQDIEVVERTLARIQELDPPGVGARDLRECLLLQLRYEGQEDSLAARVVRDHLVLLES